jgi:hypothetical protein
MHPIQHMKDVRSGGGGRAEDRYSHCPSVCCVIISSKPMTSRRAFINAIAIPFSGQ